MNKSLNSEEIVQRISGNFKYHITIVILCLLIGTCHDFILYYLSFMQSAPYVEHINDKGEDVIEMINYDICKIGNYTIVENKTYHNWIYEYNYYCSKFKVSFLSSSLIFGNILGSVISNFTYKIGSKKTLCIFCLSFVFIILILIANSYVAVVITHVLLGITHTISLIIRFSLVSEITKKNYRSYVLAMLFTSGIIASMIGYALFTAFVNWWVIYFTVAGCMLCFITSFYFYSVESIRVTISKENLEELTQSVKYIMKINGLSQVEVNNLLNDIHEESKSPKEINEPLLTEKVEFANSNNPASNIESNTHEVKVFDKNNKDLQMAEDNNDTQENVYMVFTQILISFTIYIILNNMTIFEVKNYGTDITVLIFMIFNVLSIPLFFFASFLANTPLLGRRLTLIYSFIIISIIKIISIYLDKSLMKYFYMIYRVLFFSTQAVFHALINEAFTTKNRMIFYGRIFMSAKICSLASSFILEYLSNTVYSIVIIGSLVSISAIIIFLKETRTKNIE